MKKNNISRNSSIELLRILLILGVIILHYIGDGDKLLNNAIPGTINYYLIVMINSVCVCAVDVFVIISGYYSCKSNKINFRKLIQLILQVIIFQVSLSVIVPLLKGEFSVLNVLYNFIPRNYYVTLYVSLMILSPFINDYIRKISKNTYRKFLIVLCIVFLLEPTVAEIIEGICGNSIYGISTIGILGAEYGYTIVTFVCLYFIAAYIAMYGCFWSTQWNLVVYVLSLILLFGMKLVELNIGNSIGAEHYMNPILVINALAVFEFFRNYEFASRIINFIAKGCFTVFILHMSILRHLSVASYLNASALTFIICWIEYVVIIFVLCDVIGIIYTVIEKQIFNLIQNKVGFFVLKIED